MAPPTLPPHPLTPISEDDGDEYYSSYKEANSPLTFMPEVDSVPLTPAAKEALIHPGALFQSSPSVEDLAILSGRDPSESSTISTLSDENGSWTALLGKLLGSVVDSAFSALAGSEEELDDQGLPLSRSSSLDSGSSDEGRGIPFASGLALGPAADVAALWD